MKVEGHSEYKVPNAQKARQMAREITYSSKDPKCMTRNINNIKKRT
jgi:hypothetical protein